MHSCHTAAIASGWHNGAYGGSSAATGETSGSDRRGKHMVQLEAILPSPQKANDVCPQVFWCDTDTVAASILEVGVN